MSIASFFKAYGHIKFEELKASANTKPVKALEKAQTNLLNALNLDGVVTIPNYYSADQCDVMKDEIDTMLMNDSVTKWYDDAKSDSRIYASHLHSKNITGFHKDDYLREIGEAYSKSTLINSHTLGAKLIPKSNNLGSGGGWHRDSVYQLQYKAIAYLTDVAEDNGPFEYILGSHHKSTIFKSIRENGFEANHNRFTEEEIEQFMQSNSNLKEQLFTAKKGTVILVDTSGIHRGTPIKKNSRYALTNYYFLKHQYTAKTRARFEKLF